MYLFRCEELTVLMMSKNFRYTLYILFTTPHHSPYPEPYETSVHKLCEFITKINSNLMEEIILGGKNLKFLRNRNLEKFNKLIAL